MRPRIVLRWANLEATCDGDFCFDFERRIDGEWRIKSSKCIIRGSFVTIIWFDTLVTRIIWTLWGLSFWRWSWGEMKTKAMICPWDMRKTWDEKKEVSTTVESNKELNAESVTYRASAVCNPRAPTAIIKALLGIYMREVEVQRLGAVYIIFSYL